MRSLAAEPEGAPEEGEALSAVVNLMLRFSGDLAELEALGFKTSTVASNLATGQARLEDMPAIAAHSNVVRIDMSRPLWNLDRSAATIHADILRRSTLPFRGAGVIVGVIDSGHSSQVGKMGSLIDGVHSESGKCAQVLVRVTVTRRLASPELSVRSTHLCFGDLTKAAS